MPKKQRKPKHAVKKKTPSSLNGHWYMATFIPIIAIATSFLYAARKQPSNTLLSDTHESLSPTSGNKSIHDPTKSSESALVYEAAQSSFIDVVDKNLHQMNFTLPGDDKETTFMAYITPSVSTFYQGNEQGKESLMKPRFNGLSGKFYNLSPYTLTFYWDDKKDGLYIGEAGPFETVGTATFPGHRFFFAEQDNPKNIKYHFTVKNNVNTYVYDSIVHDSIDIHSLSEVDKQKYLLQKRNLDFAAEYQKFTSREWLSLYPKRPPPMHKMWPADYFSQQHWVVTKEAHFDRLPPSELLGSISASDMSMESKRRQEEGGQGTEPGVSLQEYRTSASFNMTMSVLSCAPRVFEIKNFLSPVEVDHIVHMATGMNLQVSTVSGHEGNKRSTSTTRTSRNSWVSRGKSPIIDSIYRRAADLMMIDEALLRRRDGTGDRPDVPHKATAAEDLQLVHYDVTQEYTAHHDFSYPKISNVDQPSRFATLLLYLNDDMKGGETAFPRWMNAETSKELKVVPESGKAVLFYSVLPDGNMDDLSQHAAKPVIDGEKWLINLWTWDKKFR